jgi:HSP20 family protein
MDEQLVFVAPPVEAWIDRDKNEYHLSFALPGVELPNIQLRLQTNNLTISGDQNKGNGMQQPDYLRNEFSLGPFQRTVRLPDNVDPEKLTARQTATGMVEIVAPLKEKAAERQTSQRTS